MNENATARQSRIALGLCLLLAIALAGGVTAYWVYGSMRQRQALEALRTGGAFFLYGHEHNQDFDQVAGRPPGPKWLVDFLGVDYVAKVTMAQFSSARDEQLRRLEAFPGLRAVEINSSHLSDQGFAQLARFPGLEKLVLSALSDVREPALRILGQFKGLRILKIDDCPSVGDDILDRVSQLPDLTQFELRGPTSVTNSGLAHLARLTQLESLRFEVGGTSSDAVLKELQHLPRLRRLELKYTPGGSGDGLKYLAGLAQLEELCLVGGDVLTDSALAQLPLLPKVRELSLVNCDQISSAGMKSLERLPALIDLRPYMMKHFDDSMVIEIANRHKLEALLICDPATKLTDASFEAIGRMKSLRYLHLKDCELTHTALGYLAGLTGLNRLIIDSTGACMLDPAARKALQRSLPGCRISYRPDEY